MSINRIALTVPAALGALLMFAGCTSASPTAQSSSSTEDSPLTAYLYAIYGVAGDPSNDSAALAERQKKVENLVAACMKEKGFDYIPADGSVGAEGEGLEWKPDDREWVSQNGYGMLRSTETVDVADPNQDYVASLSESERTAYNEALWGTFAADGSAGEYDPSKAGCQGAAQAEVMGQNPFESDEFADLRTAIQDLYAEVTSSPEQQKLDADWSTCMADAGYPNLKTQQDAAAGISERVSQLSGDGSAPADESKIAELKEVEINTALADLDCREKTDYAARSKKVRWAAEEKFVADHKSELDAAKTAAEQARS